MPKFACPDREPRGLLPRTGPATFRRGLCLTGFILLAGACDDRRTPIGPESDASDPNRSAGALHESEDPLSVAGTLTDEFSAMARRIPGGFGGLYFDEKGILNIILVDTTRGADAQMALAAERFVRARANGAGGDMFDVHAARITPGRHAHDQLQRWLDRVLRGLPVTPTKSGIRVSENRILIGVASMDQELAVRQAIDEAGVPQEAVIVELSAPAVPLASLYDRFRPVPGGVQVRYLGEGEKWCTIGPNLLWTTWQGSTRSFIVNSHCTEQPFSVSSGYTTYWQPVYTSGTSNHIGNEVIDPPLFTCVENPSYGCRNSDAALGHYVSYASYELGYIAKPTTRNTGTLTVDASTPRFEIVGRFGWAIEGETLEKVGRTTGWSGGTVVDGCLTVQVADTYSIRCSMIVDADAGSGDSGAPVFKITSGNQVKLRGMLHAGQGSCSWGVDPVYSAQTRYCSQFVASNLGGIEMDLNPNNSAVMTYW